ncbi:hypothetical protein CRI94_01340 [Longibacter salinarum]|uniref:Uncharacterized protein n=1 Tax=Longibacter salinarum TaxID=1850348 RepID=A0A2A8D205_9BACT|nr:hypothetical protein [Longibacter salinarum]PEN14965.1 hypothetical protein CRI94_01340 [Longibacter salinarum]
MADEPQTETISAFLLDFGAALGWGVAYPIFVAGLFLLGNHFKSLVTGIPLIRGIDAHLILPFLPEALWLQTLIVIAIGIILISIAAVLHPPCARRLLDRKLMEVSDSFIWY